MARVLHLGSDGGDVAELQRRLSQAGYRVRIDGQYGRETEAAVRQFQRDRGVSVDGAAGPETLGAFSVPTPRPKPGAAPDALPAYNAPVETAELPPLPDHGELARALVAADGDDYMQGAPVSPGLFAGAMPDRSGETSDFGADPIDPEGYGTAQPGGWHDMPGPMADSSGMTTDYAPGLTEEMIRQAGMRRAVELAARNRAMQMHGNSPMAAGLAEYAPEDTVPEPGTFGEKFGAHVSTDGTRALAAALARKGSAERERRRYYDMPPQIGSPSELMQAIRHWLAVPKAGM